MGCDAMLGAQCTRLISHRIHTVPINAAGEDYLQSVRTLLGVNVKCAQFPFPLIIPAMCMSAPRPSPACVCVSSGHWWGVRVMGQSVSTGPDLSPLSLSISLSWPRDYFCQRPSSLLASDWSCCHTPGLWLVAAEPSSCLGWWESVSQLAVGNTWQVSTWDDHLLSSANQRTVSGDTGQSEASVTSCDNHRVTQDLVLLSIKPRCDFINEHLSHFSEELRQCDWVFLQVVFSHSDRGPLSEGSREQQRGGGGVSSCGWIMSRVAGEERAWGMGDWSPPSHKWVLRLDTDSDLYVETQNDFLQ